jgi:hypothetical protein
MLSGRNRRYLTQQNDIQHKGLVNVTRHNNAPHNAQCLNAECRVSFSVMLSVMAPSNQLV